MFVPELFDIYGKQTCRKLPYKRMPAYEMSDPERLFDVYGEQTFGKRPYKRLPAYGMSDPERLFDVYGLSLIHI